MSEPAPSFDPRGLLAALDRHRVAYIVVGAFARVVQGADERTRGIDIVPSTREENLRRLEAALAELGARRPDGSEPALAGDGVLEPVVELTTNRCQLKIIPGPLGTGGYEDLRRAATREHIGQGLRPAIASLGDSHACSPRSAAKATCPSCSIYAAWPSSRSATASRSELSTLLPHASI